MKKTKAAAKPKTKREAIATDVVAKVAKPAKERKAPKAAKAPKEGKTRGRQGNVRGLILDLLAGGPMTTSELVTKGGFSSAAAFMHLKALRADGTIASARNGREVMYSLSGAVPVATDSAAATGTAAPAKHGRKPKAAKAAPVKKGANTSVDADLERLARRLAPIDQVARKVALLEKLADSVPASVASVLNAIRDDLNRIAG